MSLPLREPVSASHRNRVLHALGLIPWLRRPRLDAVVVMPEPSAPMQPAAAVLASQAADVAIDRPAHVSSEVACVVVLPQDCSTRELDLLGRALNACGATLARAARVTVSGGELVAPVPAARAYLVFGEAQAHALGRRLSAAVLHGAQIVLADEPVLVLTRADAKRRLWSALRTLRRALATTDR